MIVVGQGTGDLTIGGVPATTLANATYSETGDDVLASAAIYQPSPGSGSFTATWTSTTYLSNSGTSLGAVAHVLKPVLCPAEPRDVAARDVAARDGAARSHRRSSLRAMCTSSSHTSPAICGQTRKGACR